MWTSKPGDTGILFTGLSNYQKELKEDLKTFPDLPKGIKEEFERCIKRIDEILEEL